MQKNRAVCPVLRFMLTRDRAGRDSMAVIGVAMASVMATPADGRSRMVIIVARVVGISARMSPALAVARSTTIPMAVVPASFRPMLIMSSLVGARRMAAAMAPLLGGCRARHHRRNRSGGHRGGKHLA